MRHKLDIPTIISARQRVPELSVVIDREKLVQFIKENNKLLADFMNIFRLPKEQLMEHASHELLVSLNGYPVEHQQVQLATEVADKVWSQHLKPRLINIVHHALVEQAITYTHAQHIQEVPFEDGKESRERLMQLVAEAITERKILSQPIQIQIKPTYQVMPEDLQPYLDQIFTETVREIYAVLDALEHPLEAALYKNYFNDTVPTKFSLDMLERYHCGKCAVTEIIEWSLGRPDYWMQELLSNCSRNIDRDPNVSGDEKLTQKAACYQLLKSIFLGGNED